jgi:LysM repeat protein
MPLDVSKYYLIRSSSGANVLAMRGDGLPKIVSGGARYNVVNRPRRKSTVEWDGDDPYRMDLPIMLDGWIKRTSVEFDVARINQMFRSPGDFVTPVTVLVDGAVPVKGAKWVVEGIDWGDQAIWATDARGQGYRLRQDAIIHLLQFVEPSVLKVAIPNSTAFQIVTKVQQTIEQIAREWNISAQAILKANNLRDSKSVKANTHLIVPGNLWNVPIKPGTAATKQQQPAGPEWKKAPPRQLRGRG